MASFLERIFGKLFGSKHERDLKAIQPVVDQINVFYKEFDGLSNDALRGKTAEFRARIAEHLREIDAQISGLLESAASAEDHDARENFYRDADDLRKQRNAKLEEVLEQILPEAFAVVKQTARRFSAAEYVEATATENDRHLAASVSHILIDGDKVRYKNRWMAAGIEVHWNMVHYDVQLIGGIMLHRGKISEMATGEGKTLVATLPAYLNGLSGEGVHIVTVNDYLARRDSEWNGPLFQFLGLSIDCIDKYQPHSPERRRAYRADITYGTNNEFGFDYLRDNMVRSPEELVQRPHHYAMVDEVDSVLVDDARTPLIISGQVDSGDEKEFYELKPRLSRLFDVQKRDATQFLTDAKRLIKEGKSGPQPGEGGFALYKAYRCLPKNNALIKFLSESGMRQILQQTENYYLQEQQKNMPQVDKELYFHIDEKNNSVELTDKGIEFITGVGEDPHFFVIPDVGASIAEIEKSGMPEEEKLQNKDRLMQEFAVKSERIHSVSQLLKAYAIFERDVDYVVMDGKVKIVDENTGRILEGRRYSDGLHQAIEAKENVKVEAASQTLATVTLQNYFRMYHKLAGMTGTAETEAGEFWDIYKLEVSVIPTNKAIVRKDMEDFVYKTKREKYNAIIDDIVKLTEAGRPVLVGTTSVEVSELLSRMLNIRKIRHNVLNAKQHQREAEIVAEAGNPGTVTIATNMAGRGTDIKISEAVKQAGGLAIIGSERHDSRRVDRQLRGRAGRQGDPGSSQFYVSLEDELMRLFGSERIANLMDRMGHEEGEVIQHSMITKSIERAQKKVEENNFGIRKRLLEYDDVMNRQREVIYTRRRNALFGERLANDLQNSFYDLCEELVGAGKENNDHESFKLDVIRCFAMDTPITAEELQKQDAAQLTERLYAQVSETYERKMNALSAQTLPVLQSIFQDKGESIRFVAIPFSDGIRGLNVVVNLAEEVETECRNIRVQFEKNITLALIDEAWKNHLRRMDDLKSEVQTASYEQKDPLVIYKIESFNLFKELISTVNRDVASYLFKGQVPAINNPTLNSGPVKAMREPARPAPTPRLKESRDEIGAATASGGSSGAETPAQEVRKTEPVRVGDKIGRNDPCPCGSGKKYKKCHGAHLDD